MEKKNLSESMLERMRTGKGKVCRRILVGITAFATAYSLITPASTLNAEEAEENGLLPEKTSDVTEEGSVEEPVSAEEETPVIEEEPQETAEPAVEEQQEISEEQEIVETGNVGIYAAGYVFSEDRDGRVEKTCQNAEQNAGGSQIFRGKFPVGDGQGTPCQIQHDGQHLAGSDLLRIEDTGEDHDKDRRRIQQDRRGGNSQTGNAGGVAQVEDRFRKQAHQ